jgi:hypothetical protein
MGGRSEMAVNLALHAFVFNYRKCNFHFLWVSLIKC